VFDRLTTDAGCLKSSSQISKRSVYKALQVFLVDTQPGSDPDPAFGDARRWSGAHLQTICAWPVGPFQEPARLVGDEGLDVFPVGPRCLRRHTGRGQEVSEQIEGLQVAAIVCGDRFRARSLSCHPRASAAMSSTARVVSTATPICSSNARRGYSKAFVQVAPPAGVEPAT
jgi:hypothetical protein